MSKSHYPSDPLEGQAAHPSAPRTEEVDLAAIWPIGRPASAPRTHHASWLVRNAKDLPAVRAAAIHTSAAGHSGDLTSIRDSVAARIGVVVGELVGNAIRHASQPIQLMLSLSFRTWLVEVSDGDPARGPSPRPATQGLEGGFGLGLVRSVSTEIGWWQDGTCKVIWAELGDAPPTTLVTH
ncbi:MAG: ATP-binding protein [Actinomycetota bacterium]